PDINTTTTSTSTATQTSEEISTTSNTTTATVDVTIDSSTLDKGSPGFMTSITILCLVGILVIKKKLKLLKKKR
ncbi:MAG: hypothetical protein ACTSR2_08745, partial [Candidatus Hodarchaeales archaeon]